MLHVCVCVWMNERSERSLRQQISAVLHMPGAFSSFPECTHACVYVCVCTHTCARSNYTAATDLSSPHHPAAVPDNLHSVSSWVFSSSAERPLLVTQQHYHAVFVETFIITFRKWLRSTFAFTYNFRNVKRQTQPTAGCVCVCVFAFFRETGCAELSSAEVKARHRSVKCGEGE